MDISSMLNVATFMQQIFELNMTSATDLTARYFLGSSFHSSVSQCPCLGAFGPPAGFAIIIYRSFTYIIHTAAKVP